MTLTEFFGHVAEVDDGMRRAGLVTVYFMHDTLSPGNVRFTWDDHPVRKVPEEGDLITSPHGGYMGTPVRWIATKVDWHSGAGATVHCESFAPRDGAPWLDWQDHPGYGCWTRVKDDGSRALTLMRNEETGTGWHVVLAFEAGGKPDHAELRITEDLPVADAQILAEAFQAGASSTVK
jgi:hypothetical protein